jgi:hypothetical protein
VIAGGRSGGGRADEYLALAVDRDTASDRGAGNRLDLGVPSTFTDAQDDAPPVGSLEVRTFPLSSLVGQNDTVGHEIDHGDIPTSASGPAAPLVFAANA